LRVKVLVVVVWGGGLTRSFFMVKCCYGDGLRRVVGVWLRPCMFGSVLIHVYLTAFQICWDLQDSFWVGDGFQICWDLQVSVYLSYLFRVVCFILGWCFWFFGVLFHHHRSHGGILVVAETCLLGFSFYFCLVSGPPDGAVSGYW
jgi:hypothetical protein